MCALCGDPTNERYGHVPLATARLWADDAHEDMTTIWCNEDMALVTHERLDRWTTALSALLEALNAADQPLPEGAA